MMDGHVSLKDHCMVTTPMFQTPPSPVVWYSSLAAPTPQQEDIQIWIDKTSH